VNVDAKKTKKMLGLNITTHSVMKMENYCVELVSANKVFVDMTATAKAIRALIS
jgi:hypothetical protein